jgi:hypothetical protein
LGGTKLDEQKPCIYEYILRREKVFEMKKMKRVFEYIERESSSKIPSTYLALSLCLKWVDEGVYL